MSGRWERDSDPAAVANALDISLGQGYATLASYYEHPEEGRRHRAEAATGQEEFRDRMAEPTAAVDTAE